MYTNSHTLRFAVMAVKLLTAQVGQKYNSHYGDQNLTIPDGPTLSLAKPQCRGVKRVQICFKACTYCTDQSKYFPHIEQWMNGSLSAFVISRTLSVLEVQKALKLHIRSSSTVVYD